MQVKDNDILSYIYKYIYICITKRFLFVNINLNTGIYFLNKGQYIIDNTHSFSSQVLFKKKGTDQVTLVLSALLLTAQHFSLIVFTGRSIHAKDQ